MHALYLCTKILSSYNVYHGEQMENCSFILKNFKSFYINYLFSSSMYCRYSMFEPFCKYFQDVNTETKIKIISKNLLKQRRLLQS